MQSYFELKDPDEIKKKIKRPSTALKIANGLNLKISDIFFDVNASKSTQKESVV